MSRLASLAALAALALSAGRAPADVGKPSEAWPEIAAVVKQATSWEQVFPYMSYEYRRYVERRDPEARVKLFDSFKRSLDLRDVVITKERVVRGDAEIDVTGVDAAGKPVKGTIDFELERGAWKLDELSWSPIE